MNNGENDGHLQSVNIDEEYLAGRHLLPRVPPLHRNEWEDPRCVSGNPPRHSSTEKLTLAQGGKNENRVHLIPTILGIFVVLEVGNSRQNVAINGHIYLLRSIGWPNNSHHFALPSRSIAPTMH